MNLDEDDNERNDDNEPEGENDEQRIVQNRREITHQRLTRRHLTNKRLVHSIDSALDPANYNMFIIPEEEITFKSRFKIDRNANNDIIYQWTNQPPPIGQPDQSSVIRGPCGKPTPRARNTATALDAFLKFFTNEMVSSVVLYTNEKISKVIATPETKSVIHLVEEREMLAFIGLFIYRGMYKQNTMSVKTLFSDEYGLPMYGAVMSRNRFEFLPSNLCFDDPDNRDERWKKDRFAAIRELFEAFNKQCLTMMAPSDYLSIDETLYPMSNTSQINLGRMAYCSKLSMMPDFPIIILWHHTVGSQSRRVACTMFRVQRTL